MKRYPRGSEWRKWDLHVHIPGTRLNNQYAAAADGTPDWDRFCKAIEDSDVAVVGLADYFSITKSIELIARYRGLYPQSDKLLLPNMELRLSESVNGAGEEVNVHVLFPADTSRATADRFMGNLRTELHDHGQRKLTCAEIVTTEQVESATVTRAELEAAIEATYGAKIDREDHVLLVSSCKGDGIRPLRGAKRKANLTDEIDKLSDAFFGGSGSVDHFLDTTRLEHPTMPTLAKPVFTGSDAHSFEQLAARLGRDVPAEDDRNEVTWVKADPTFEGLQQTLVEPKTRVRIQPTRPDPKEPYQHISKVKFEGSGDFPEEIVLNPNLVSVIGSRSSGKSALLAYIAHAVDPAYTIAQQMAAGVIKAEVGPAPGKTWADVQGTRCVVEWAEASAESGRIIYIPQNSLFAISRRPEEITSKIRPALNRLDPSFEVSHTKAIADIQSCNASIRTAVEEWFGLSSQIDQSTGELRNLGDKAAIAASRDTLASNISSLRESSSLSPEEVQAYQQIVDQLSASESRLKTLDAEAGQLAPYIVRDSDGGYQATEALRVDIRTWPAPEALPQDTSSLIAKLVTETRDAVAVRIAQLMAEKQLVIDTEKASLTEASSRLRADNAALIQKNQANTEIESLVNNHRKQIEALAAIAEKERELERLKGSRDAQAGAVQANISTRQGLLENLAGVFESVPRVLEGMTFGMEAAVTDDQLRAVSRGLNKLENSVYVLKGDQMVDLNKVLSDPAAFLSALAGGTQKINRGDTNASVAIEVLTATPEIRFFATLEGDRVGGFTKSSMTPGKQALFALTLILNEAEGPWPLLIDQPEDDLDSRSIYDTIVPYLMNRRDERQIIMASHNANLVIGADSEQVIVANRHGEDRKNADGRLFDYLTGSLEHSQVKNDSQVVLESCGVKEHACDILDGGREAFHKRQLKYKIQ